jgi:hypothetical protein
MKWEHWAAVGLAAVLIYALRPGGQLAGAVSSTTDATAAVALAGA